MVKDYKRKRHIEENSSDSTSGIDFEGSERQKSKREIRGELKDLKPDSNEMDDLRWELEIKLAFACMDSEKTAKEKGLPFACGCPDPYAMTDDEVLNLFYGGDNE